MHKYLVRNYKYHHTQEKNMKNLFKLWAAINVPSTWNNELEQFITARNPQTIQDLELAIRDYEQTA